jgi:hypothetical protein
LGMAHLPDQASIELKSLINAATGAVI